VLAGSDSSTPEDACTVNGDLTSTGGLLALAPGGSIACPVFVIALQPAKEGATYSVHIAPPELQPPPQQPLPQQPQTLFLPNQPPPAGQPSPTASVVSPTETPWPEPTSSVAGERTSGAAVTPLAPATGTSLVQRRESSGIGVAPALVVLGGLSLLLAACWPRKPAG
jgi:hypothetical protein